MGEEEDHHKLLAEALDMQPPVMPDPVTRPGSQLARMHHPMVLEKILLFLKQCGMIKVGVAFYECLPDLMFIIYIKILLFLKQYGMWDDDDEEFSDFFRMIYATILFFCNHM